MTTRNEQIRRWYFKGSYVPQLGTMEFAKFAAHGYAMIESILGNNDYTYVIDPTSPAAYWNMGASQIAMPAWYFFPETLGKLIETPDSMDALCLINGSTIHESLHAKYTPKLDLRQRAHLISLHASAQTSRKIGMQVTATVMNIVEDLIIETAKLPGNLGMWIEVKNEILFNNSIVADVIAKFDPSNIINMIETLVVYKREDVRNEVGRLFGDSVERILKTIVRTKPNAPESLRNKLTEDLIVAIVELADASTPEPEVEDEPEPGESDESGDEGEGAESEGTEGDGTESGETGETGEETESTDEGTESESKSESETDEPGETGKSDKSGETETDTESGMSLDSDEMPSDGETSMVVDEDTAAEIEKTLSEIDESDRKDVEREFNREAKTERKELHTERTVDEYAAAIDKLTKNLKTVDVHQVSYDSSEDLEEIKFSSRFATMLKQLRTVLPTHGRGKLTGGKLDNLRLHNVAIDGKVFSTKTTETAGLNDKVEIVLLIDASGSMSRRIDEDGCRFNLFSRTVSVANKIHMALVNAGVMVSTFAHTSTYDVNNPQLVVIATPQTRLVKNNFRRALTIALRENLDGIIINEIANKHFHSDNRTRKVLIVLSDGSPQSPNYPGGSMGTAHTKSVVEKVRKNGIQIVAVSLVSSVMTGNNRIYGEENNFDASEDLDKAMTQLVTRLVTTK